MRVARVGSARRTEGGANLLQIYFLGVASLTMSNPLRASSSMLAIFSSGLSGVGGGISGKSSCV